MKNTLVLEMINNGEIETLKAALQDEIYVDNMSGNGTAKKRYAAMKRYFKYANQNKKMLQMPCKDYEMPDGKYNVFFDGYTLVLTSEDIGEITPFDNSEGSYFKVEKMINYLSGYELLDFNTILAEAKSKGYKYKKSEVGAGKDFNYCFRHKDGYYKVGLLDQAFSIINDGKEAEVYYSGAKSILLIKTSIGICGILPFNADDKVEERKTVIKVA